MKCIHGLRVFLTVAATACVVGCSAGSGSAPSQSTGSTTNSAQTGSVYVLGTDAPLPSVVSFSVAQRTSEFAIRIALGAKKSDVLRNVLSAASIGVVSGVVVGLSVSLGMTRLMKSWVSRGDPGAAG